jgi:hypothetical protein
MVESQDTAASGCDGLTNQAHLYIFFFESLILPFSKRPGSKTSVSH